MLYVISVWCLLYTRADSTIPDSKQDSHIAEAGPKICWEIETNLANAFFLLLVTLILNRVYLLS